jgi:hypothetical protein
VVFEQGDIEAACSLFQRSLAAVWEPVGPARSGFRPLPLCLEGLARVAAAREQKERAARLFGAAEALREAAGAPFPSGARAGTQPAERAAVEQHVATVRTALGSEAFAAAWAAGRAMTLDEAVAYALER